MTLVISHADTDVRINNRFSLRGSERQATPQRTAWVGQEDLVGEQREADDPLRGCTPGVGHAIHSDRLCNLIKRHDALPRANWFPTLVVWENCWQAKSSRRCRQVG